MDTPWRIQLLGCLRALQGDWTITRFRSQRTASLLAYLAYHSRHPHPREVLIELLWPEGDLESGRNGLRVALSSLRHQLEPPGILPGSVLVADRTFVQLSPAACVTDAAEFETALRAARAASGGEKTQGLVEAVELYGGALLPGYFEGWILPERLRLAEAYLQALEQLAVMLQEQGDLHRAVQYARRAVSVDPLREEAHQAVMRLLGVVGQPEAALRQYDELERLLAQELNATPGPEIHSLAQQIRIQARERGAAAVNQTRAAPADGPSLAAHDRTASPAEDSPQLAHLAPHPADPQRPSGTVTLLLTDIGGALSRREVSDPAFVQTMADSRTFLHEAIRQHGGFPVEENDDGALAAFQRADHALAAALAFQRVLAARSSSESASPLRARMALHTGGVEGLVEVSHGPVLQCVRRVLQAGHEGQILCSEESASLLRRELSPELQLVDLGVYRLRDVATPERLFQLEYPEMREREFPPLNAAPAHSGHLPLQFTRFFGREAEIVQLREMLLAEENRLVTLTGPGGSGKSRLALEVAQRLREALRGAVWHVSLLDLTDAALIVDKALDSLRLPRSPQLDPLVQVVATLSRQPSLLLLDGFEHLVAGGATVVQTLLERVPTLTLLVTSRRRLELAAEREYPVYPLEVPDVRRDPTDTRHPTPDTLTQYPSVRLFVDRAQAVRADFQVTAGNAAAVAAMCARLEGIPLALELAAARARMLTPQQMLTRLEQRFELLVSRQRDAGPSGTMAGRHRSLRAALDWSYQLLSPELRRFFARLSVFRGGWSLEAAEAICEEKGDGYRVSGVGSESGHPTPDAPVAVSSPVLEYLEQLRECSMLQAEESGGEMRYRLLETLREYALEQVPTDERDELSRRHAVYFHGLAQRAELELLGVHQPAWLEQLEREHDNMRAALTWAEQSGAAEIGLALAGALWEFWAPRGHLAEGRERLAALLALPGSAEMSEARAKALACAGVLAQFQSDYAAARPLLQESLAIRQEREDLWGVAFCLTALGFVVHYQREYEAAQAFQEEGLGIWRQLGNQTGIAWSLNGLADVAGHQGDLDRERDLQEQSLRIRRELGDRWGAAFSLSGLGTMARYRGDWETARSYYEESLALRRELGDRAGVATSLTHLGNVAVRQDETGPGRALLEEGLAIRQSLGDQGGIAESLHSLGLVACRQRNWEAARSLFEESLALRREFGDPQGAAECLEGLAAVALERSQPERAVRLLGAATALREAIGAPLPPVDRPNCERQLAAGREELGELTFERAWQSGRALTWQQAATAALAPAPSTRR